MRRVTCWAWHKEAHDNGAEVDRGALTSGIDDNRRFTFGSSMNKIRGVALIKTLVVGVGVLGLTIARPHITARRIETHLLKQPPGTTGPVFAAISPYDRPEDVLARQPRTPRS